MTEGEMTDDSQAFCPACKVTFDVEDSGERGEGSRLDCDCGVELECVEVFNNRSWRWEVRP